MSMRVSSSCKAVNRSLLTGKFMRTIKHFVWSQKKFKKQTFERCMTPTDTWFSSLRVARMVLLLNWNFGVLTLCTQSLCPLSLCTGHFVPWSLCPLVTLSLVTLSPGHFVSGDLVPNHFSPGLCLQVVLPLVILSPVVTLSLVTLSFSHFLSLLGVLYNYD
jgi:hypothetical protein